MELKNKRNVLIKYLYITLGILYPIIIVIVFSINNISEVWNSWGINEQGVLINPDGLNYSLLIVFKLSLYLFPSMIIAIGLTIINKDKVVKWKYMYYVLSSLSLWFLGLLSIKLFFETIMEVDRIFDFKMFESIKDVQTLIGFIVTVVLKRTYEIKPGFIKQVKLEDFAESKNRDNN